jgi:hypothetical protein
MLWLTSQNGYSTGIAANRVSFSLRHVPFHSIKLTFIRPRVLSASSSTSAFSVGGYL